MKILCKPIAREMLLLLLLLFCTGCAKQLQTGKENEIVDLMQNVTVDAVDMEEREEKQADAETASAAFPEKRAFCVDTADFAIMLLQENMTGRNENVIISPVSALTALAMTANGADGDTREQMLEVLSPNQSIDSLNDNIEKWTGCLVSTEDASVKIANSIWFDENAGGMMVNEFFLQQNARYYHADIFKASFQDSTLDVINQWAADKTDGMISRILEQIPSDTQMYLLNAVSFDAKWERAYLPESDVHERIFINASGEKENVEMMCSREHYYIEDENAVGFIKPYKEGYSFVAMLPNEGMSMKEYVDTLSGAHFLDMLAEAGMDGIDILEVGLPKFEAEYEVELSDKLWNMGMSDAFDYEKADFSGIGKIEAEEDNENLAISGVYHKTYIVVDELGTKAAAVTNVGAAADSAEESELTRVSVYLDRPFLYAIVEKETNVPIFIGVVNTIGK